MSSQIFSNFIADFSLREIRSSCAFLRLIALRVVNQLLNSLLNRSFQMLDILLKRLFFFKIFIISQWLQRFILSKFNHSQVVLVGRSPLIRHLSICDQFSKWLIHQWLLFMPGFSNLVIICRFIRATLRVSHLASQPSLKLLRFFNFWWFKILLIFLISLFLRKAVLKI